MYDNHQQTIVESMTKEQYTVRLVLESEIYELKDFVTLSLSNLPLETYGNVRRTLGVMSI